MGQVKHGRQWRLLRGVGTAGILLAGGGRPVAQAANLVTDGGARAEILIASAPPRMVKLAAEELRDHIERISGARLEIVTEPTAAVPLRLYVGRSAVTDALGLDAADLADGAFLLKTVADGLVLLGRDTDFVPREPWAHSPEDTARMLADWDRITGGTFGNPLGGSLLREYSRAMDLWAQDERGSLNAAHEFLRGLGVRWYMPGELGTVLPRRVTIALPEEDRIVRPAMRWRQCHFATFFSSPREEILWYLRQGFNHRPLDLRSHGLAQVTTRPEMKAAHPDRYALVRGRRLTDDSLGKGNQACLSSEGLFEEAVRYARAVFGHFGTPTVSMFPQDGFQFCECDLCRGKDTPARGREGLHSDYVWGFVDRVARELHRTHPDRTVNCLAYGTYLLPPLALERLSPNVQVGLLGARGREFDDPATRERLLALRAAWRARTGVPFWNWEHYPFTHRNTIVPFFFPRAIADGLRSMRDDFEGEFIEVPFGPINERGHGLHAPGFNHLNLYVTGRFQWNPDQDLDALLEEYFRLFYGPAAETMQAFVETCEATRIDLPRDTGKIDAALALFDEAATLAAPESVHGRRIALLREFLEPLRAWREQLVRGRVGVPRIRLAAHPGTALTLDGRLDEAVWKQLPAHPLADIEGGGKPAHGAAFQLFWDGDERQGHLGFGMRCEEPDMANLRVLTSEAGDWRVLDGDTVELMLETQLHSYYQLAINPAGALVDIDRHLGRLNHAWSSMAQVAAHRGEDFWSLEARIPVTGAETIGDPLHEVAGARPRPDAPWHLNVGRQRLRGDQREWTVWSPPEPPNTGFHDVMRFGRLD